MFKFSIPSFWTITPFLILFFFLLPVLMVLASLLGDYSDNWAHLYDYVLVDYISNTLYLIIGVSLLSLLIGTVTAWIVTTYDFFGKRFLEWALILPLATPPYILAYTFTGFFDAFGTANNFIRDIFSLDQSFIFFPNIRNIYGAVIVFSFTLYPYIYLVSRSAFLNQSRSMLEAGRMLGLSQFEIFYKLSLPIIRPAVIGGLMLVIMETISDFGAVDHFAIQTFTTGVFRTWHGMYDLKTAMQLASILLIFVATFVWIEKISRKKALYTSGTSTFKPTKKIKLLKYKAFISFFICFIPILIGFILPITELIIWAISYNLSFFNEKFLLAAMNTILLSITAAVLCASIALIINFSIRFKKYRFSNFLSSFLSLGYAVPGLILAVGIVQLFALIDQNILFNSDIILTGSIVGLIFAYIIKSYALANSTFESGFQRISTNLDDSARTLKSSGWNLLSRVHLPLLKTSFLTSILMVTSEVVKELPATLILRPFNFDTLAVATYIYAAEERMFQAAAPAIAIMLVGLIPIILLTKMISSSRPMDK
ncbi:MAG: ABC transporter permease [Woeseiaceae bacterium]|nr:iron ABC transporter permease [Woeseiaceae bacterium]